MLEQLRSWLGLARKAPAEAPAVDRKALFHQALAHYPVHAPPHLGWGSELSPEQAQQNLDWFNVSLPERMASVRALMKETGLDLSDADLAPATLEDALDVVARLIEWTRACWPDEPYLPEHRDIDYWAESTREGEDKIFSVVLDVATVLGQLARAGRPEWRWGLDMDPSSLGSQPMLTARRVLLKTAPLGPRRLINQMDMEMLVKARYLKPRDLDFTGPLEYDQWVAYVRDGYTGRGIDMCL